MPDVIQRMDEAILLFIQNEIRCPFLDVIMKTASLLGDAGIMWIVLGLVLVVIKKTRRGGAYMLTALAAEYCVNDLILKKIIMRTRPYDAIEALVSIIGPQSSTSFPSGHTASSFVCAYMLTRYFGKWGALSYIPAALIAFSRMYVGVHYFTDILGGIAVGTLVGVVSWLLLEKFTKKCRTK